jgi:thiamine biosynthesis protein ThiS
MALSLSLSPFATMNIALNGQNRQIADNATVAQLLEELRLAGKPVAVEVNRELVPHAIHGRRRLAEGDRVEVVTLVGGG